MTRITVAHDGRLTHDGRKAEEPFANYLYAVFDDGRRVAEVTHTCRGDELSMRLVGGDWVDAQDRIITGGGPEPVRLTKAGEQLLDKLRRA